MPFQFYLQQEYSVANSTILAPSLHFIKWRQSFAREANICYDYFAFMFKVEVR